MSPFLKRLFHRQRHLNSCRQPLLTCKGARAVQRHLAVVAISWLYVLYLVLPEINSNRKQDVAGLVWYSEVFINTAATAHVSVGVANGSTATASRTSVVQNEGDFTFYPVGPTENAALTQVNYEPTVNVGGAILSSPTAYNVFTGILNWLFY